MSVIIRDKDNRCVKCGRYVCLVFHGQLFWDEFAESERRASGEEKGGENIRGENHFDVEKERQVMLKST